MKKFLMLLSLVIAASATSGCVRYSDYVNIITDKGIELARGMKVGEACRYLGFFGTATIKAAADNAKISNVRYVEHKVGPFHVCVYAYGF